MLSGLLFEARELPRLEPCGMISRALGGHMPSAAQNSTVHAQPLIAVRDVRTSSQWYVDLLGADALPEHKHRDLYERVYSDGRVILQLHAWDQENHSNLVNRAAAPPGHGVLLWFQLDDFDAAVKRARLLKAEVVEDAHINPAPGQWELWLRDPDGYVVVIAGPPLAKDSNRDGPA
jgi:catechol 2,3-dioxygenase-like lactoylglutathione lyase family enzyme